MHCPKCGQQQITEETRFCSRCGFLLTGVSQVVANEGQIPASSQGKPEKLSPRRRGVRKGLFFFLLSFLILPIIMLLTIAAEADPYILFAAAVIFIVGGLLRAAYALMFESPDETPLSFPTATGHNNQPHAIPSGEPNALPETSTIPAAAYTAPPATGMWRDANDLQKTPHSVTDSTTKLLERDQ
jgi:predicted nucleic acid-binding Zn ribbon protein